MNSIKVSCKHLVQDFGSTSYEYINIKHQNTYAVPCTLLSVHYTLQDLTINYLQTRKLSRCRTHKKVTNHHLLLIRTGESTFMAEIPLMLSCYRSSSLKELIEASKRQQYIVILGRRGGNWTDKTGVKGGNDKV